MSMGVSGEETGAVRGNSRERDGAQSQGTWPRAGASVLEGGSLDSLSSPALPLAAQGCPPTATYWGPSLPWGLGAGGPVMPTNPNSGREAPSHPRLPCNLHS